MNRLRSADSPPLSRSLSLSPFISPFAPNTEFLTRQRCATVWRARQRVSGIIERNYLASASENQICNNQACARAIKRVEITLQTFSERVEGGAGGRQWRLAKIFPRGKTRREMAPHNATQRPKWECNLIIRTDGRRNAATWFIPGRLISGY